MSVVLSDDDFQTVMKALLNAQHEFNFLHGLRVTDVPDVSYTFELDCSDVNKITEEAISVLENADCSRFSERR